MRKIMVIAALVGLGFAGIAKADKGAKIPVQIPEDKQIGDVIQPNPQIVHVSFADMEIGPVEVAPGVTRPECNIRVEIELPDGSNLQLQGDTRDGNGRGRLYPVSLPGMFTPKNYELGRFALVGRRSVILEIRGANGLALMGLFRQANLPGQSGLVQVIGTGWMVTDGHALARFDRDISTREASLQDLAGAFARAQSFPDPRQRAQQFLFEFVGNGEAPDVITRKPCVGACGKSVGLVPPGLAYGAYGVPTGTIDPSLR